MFTRSHIRMLAFIEEGVPLWGCAPGSPAALAGLRYGDIILSVNGERIRTAEEYVAAKETEGISYEIEFRRGAELLSTTIEPGPEVWPDVMEQMADTVGPESLWTLRACRAPTSLN